MKRTLFILLIIVSMGVLCAEKNDLWEKAVTIANNNWDLVPGKTTTITETKNANDGELVSSTVLVVAHELYKDLIMNDLITSTIDGKEQTREEAIKQYAEILKRDNTPKKEGMFFMEKGDDLTYSHNGEKKTINEYDCIGFDFTYNDKGHGTTYIGTVWLEKDEGFPVMKKFRMDKNPRFVTDMEITQYFHYSPETGIWHPESIDTVVHISAMGRKMLNNTQFHFADYWRYPGN